jgi:hypothetical protein
VPGVGLLGDALLGEGTPIIAFAAAAAQATPLALPTNGTVRLARGLTSMM